MFNISTSQNKAGVALDPFVSLFYLFVAVGGRKCGNRRTDGPTNLVNLRCACAPRVNDLDMQDM